jgi:predicted ester cyclase
MRIFTHTFLSKWCSIQYLRLEKSCIRKILQGLNKTLTRFRNLIADTYSPNILVVVVISTEENMRLMKTLHDSWNSQDWDIFSKRHTGDVIVRWPGQSEPTRGLSAHRNEGVQIFKMFPDNHVENNPYKVLFGQGEWTCSIAIFTGTHKGPMMGPGGKTIPPTNKKFQVDFCTVAHWKNGQN